MSCLNLHWKFDFKNWTTSIKLLSLIWIISSSFSISDFKKRLQAAKKYSNYRPSVFMKGVTKEDFVTIHENLHLFKGFYAQPKYVREYATNSSGNIFGYISQITNSLIKKICDKSYY